MHGGRQATLLIRPAHEDILFERLTGKARDLWGIRALRRHKELLGTSDTLAIPENVARLPGQQPYHCTQQRGFARTNAPRDDGTGAATQLEVYLLYTPPRLRIQIGKATSL